MLFTAASRFWSGGTVGALVALLFVGGCSNAEFYEEDPQSDSPPRMVIVMDSDAGGGGADARPGTDASTPPPMPPPQGCGSDIEQEELGFTNQARAEAGVGALSCDPLMAAVARAHSQDMCDKTYFDHTDLEGGNPGDRMREGNVTFRGWGENIHRGSPTAEGAHTSWMNSPGHRENILRGSFGRIGIGFVACSGGDYRNVWTQVFAD